MRTLIFAVALALSGTSQAQTQQDVLEQFEAVVFGSDFGAPRDLVMKWRYPPSVAFASNPPNVTGDHARDITDVHNILLDTTGLGYVAPTTEPATLSVIFYPHRSFMALADQIEASDMRLPANFRGSLAQSQCYGMIYDTPNRPGTIGGAFVLIDSELPSHRVKGCIHEELIQIMGLPADACHYRPSLFCEEDGGQTTTEADKLLLRLLYDHRIRRGMTKAEAMPIVRQILPEYWAKYGPPN